MHRRGFLGALAAVIAAPRILERISVPVPAADVNAWPVGMLDVTTSSSVHGLRTSTAPEWAAACLDDGGYEAVPCYEPVPL